MRIFKPPGTASNVPNMTENHGVPGSNPGLATSFCRDLQVKRREKNEAPTLAGASRQLRDSYR